MGETLILFATGVGRFDIIVSFRKEGGEFRVRRVWFKAAEQEREAA